MLNPSGIDLDHYAVDFIWQVGPLRLPGVAICNYSFNAVAKLPIVGCPEAQLFQRQQRLRMLGKWFFPIDEQVVREELETALRGDRRIEHPHRSRRRVSGIHENLAAGLLLL